MLTKKEKKNKQKTQKNVREEREREKTFLSASLVNEHTHPSISLPLSLPPPLSLSPHTHDSPVVTILSYNDDDDANLLASSSRLSFPPCHPSPNHRLTPSLPPFPPSITKQHYLDTSSTKWQPHARSSYGVGAASAVASVPGIRPRASDARTSPIRPSAAAAPLAEA